VEWVTSIFSDDNFKWIFSGIGTEIFFAIITIIMVFFGVRVFSSKYSKIKAGRDIIENKQKGNNNSFVINRKDKD